jgi:hypothetical protein
MWTINYQGKVEKKTNKIRPPYKRQQIPTSVILKGKSLVEKIQITRTDLYNIYIYNLVTLTNGNVAGNTGKQSRSNR